MSERVIVRWIPAVLWAGLIYLLSDQPELRSTLPNAWDLFVRKLAHIVEYAVLAGLIAYALQQGSTRRRAAFFASFVLAILYAVSDEVHQAFVQGRVGSVGDVLLDGVGAYTGTSAYLLRWKKKNTPEARS